MPEWAGQARAVEAARGAVRALSPRAALVREMRRLRRAHIHSSTALAGSSLRAEEVDALLDRGRAVGGHPFDDYLMVRAYAEAADWVADRRLRAASDGRPLLTVDELRGLHVRAMAGAAGPGGAWRLGNPPARGGIVAPAAWLVARETEALVDRFGRGPRDEPVARWIARFLARLARLQPFEAANGRTARLAANLALQRLDIPPLVFEQRDRARYPRALVAAETGVPDGLTELVATAILRACNRLVAAENVVVLPLREAAGDDYVALAKAAGRGRLRTIVRGGRYYTTAAWIEEYRARPARG